MLQLRPARAYRGGLPMEPLCADCEAIMTFTFDAWQVLAIVLLSGASGAAAMVLFVACYAARRQERGLG